MTTETNLNVEFSVFLTNGKKRKKLADFVTGTTSDTGVAVILHCDKKAELDYLAIALRACTDACQVELTRPELQLE